MRQSSTSTVITRASTVSYFTNIGATYIVGRLGRGKYDIFVTPYGFVVHGNDCNRCYKGGREKLYPVLNGLGNCASGGCTAVCCQPINCISKAILLQSGCIFTSALVFALYDFPHATIIALFLFRICLHILPGHMPIVDSNQATTDIHATVRYGLLPA